MKVGRAIARSSLWTCLSLRVALWVVNCNSFGCHLCLVRAGDEDEDNCSTVLIDYWLVAGYH